MTDEGRAALKKKKKAIPKFTFYWKVKKKQK